MRIVITGVWSTLTQSVLDTEADVETAVERLSEVLGDGSKSRLAEGSARPAGQQGVQPPKEYSAESGLPTNGLHSQPTAKQTQSH